MMTSKGGQGKPIFSFFGVKAEAFGSQLKTLYKTLLQSSLFSPSGWKTYSAIDDASGNVNGSKDGILASLELEKQKDLEKPKLRSNENMEAYGKQSSQPEWLNNLLDAAIKMYKQAVPLGGPEKRAGTASTRSLVEIASSLYKSTSIGMQDWSLVDLTFGLYLVSLQQSSQLAVDSIHGEQVRSNKLVQDFIYHAELAKGAYMKDSAHLARASMLRESKIVKFVDKASVMRPAYYIGVDDRRRLVVVGIRGTHSINDLITDLISRSDVEAAFDGGSVHFGTAEAANWLVLCELDTIRDCLRQNPGFELRLVGHSLGGAIASLVAMMLRQKSESELGFSPSIVSVVSVGAQPCVSKNLAFKSRDYISTLVLQDDVIPRVSAASLMKLRNEILLTDWKTLLEEKEETKGIVDIVSSTVQAISSVQDAARKYGIYEKLLKTSDNSETNKNMTKKEVARGEDKDIVKQSSSSTDELVLPGSLYHLCGYPIIKGDGKGITDKREGCILRKGYPNEHFGRIILSRTMLSDHRCDNYYFGLRDVLKGLPYGND